MAPFTLFNSIGQFGFFAVVFLIGIGFGAALEASGFGDSRKLSAQFYLKDMTVLKVMFSAIVVAMVLIFLSSAMGLLDYDAIYVNTTYLMPGIVGGLIMGVGFVIGGFCPGTSLVAMASLKLDGLLFVIGVLLGAFLFGETIDSTFSEFWNSGNMGRFTLQDWLGIDADVVVLIVVLMALTMFLLAEKIEAKMNGSQKPSFKPSKYKLAFASSPIIIALIVLISGQPTAEEKWTRLPQESRQKLEKRMIHVEPIEMLHVMKGRNTKPVLFDIRPESEFNRFHIIDAEHVPIDYFNQPENIRHLKQASNSVYFIISDKEPSAEKVWKLLAAEKVQNAYILEGGTKGWIDYFGHQETRNDHMGETAHHLANPDFHHFKDIKFTPKVKLAKVKAAAGGCG